MEHTKCGAYPRADGVQFNVWAPEAKSVELVLYEDGDNESSRTPMTINSVGVYQLLTKSASAGSKYKYVIDGNGPFPDPTSRYQPDGVHGCSVVVDQSFAWTDSDWKGIPSLEGVSIYELHFGTFTKEGTYKAAQEKLPYLKKLGITTVEVLPLADFPGRWNWGYDGVALYAPARCYGSPAQLKEFVNEAHKIGLAVIIDLVYNHLGPDGNYLNCYNKRYFTAKHNTPWGAALNYDRSTSTDDSSKEVSNKDAKTDAEHAPQVRAFIQDNAEMWIRDYHFDGARLDATHAIVDYSKPHVLQDLVSQATKSAGDRKLYFFAEDDRNETDLVSRENGLSSLWADDFHHQVRVKMAGDNESYFANFTGSTEDLAKTIKQGWFFTGQVVPNSEKEGKPEHRGTDALALKNLSAFCCCIQNHDQIGNRALGERLNHQITASAYKTASALLLLIPATPMLFQGQEWSATSPFQFFTDHNADLGKLVTEGRRKEFGKFKAFNDPATQAKIPDPQAESTFNNSKLEWTERTKQPHAGVEALYSALLHLRLKEFNSSSRDGLQVTPLGKDTLLLVRPTSSSSQIAVVFHFTNTEFNVDLSSHVSKQLSIVLTTADEPYATGDKETVPVLSGSVVKGHGPVAVVLRA
eukprot:TRINITY_DN836_c0_g1_i1.p1 TRINITY_DN836_c0_g1~~TRINITY_DN836_c0_g1_i1.p1  ORF type:complete len:637 (+),score=219.24 TRINITY_DN836_c0_g1_i1:170-2080(+)